TAYPSPRSSPPRRQECAVLGAGGFVGARLVEVLNGDSRFNVRPVVRRFSALSRVARFDLKWRLADAKNEAELIRAFEGCESVVHCAAVNPADLDKNMEPVYRAAERAGVRRLAYLSSASVHGQSPEEGCDERAALRDDQELDYNNAKVRAEWELKRLRQSGRVEAITLRPGLVYGPRSRWIAETVRTISSGNAYLVGAGEGIFNGIYIDNLIHAILLSLTADADRCDKQAFLLGEEPLVRWRDFVRVLCDGMNRSFETISCVAGASEQRGGWKERIDSVRTSSLAKSVLPLIPAKSKRAVKAALAAYSAPEARTDWSLPAPLPLEVTREMTLLHQCRWKFPYKKAADALGYAPLFTFDEGMRRSIDWLKAAGLDG
ncbi:MAG TPA: NAD-dependent epimerase/dehydratase family protein, partial [Planctomycetota bacterium]|nr:NAD-dependent epimerase/dehydratase family protein [Planctomycetota bacterium]